MHQYLTGQCYKRGEMMQLYLTDQCYKCGEMMHLYLTDQCYTCGEMQDFGLEWSTSFSSCSTWSAPPFLHQPSASSSVPLLGSSLLLTSWLRSAMSSWWWVTPPLLVLLFEGAGLLSYVTTLNRWNGLLCPHQKMMGCSGFDVAAVHVIVLYLSSGNPACFLRR